MRQSLLLLTDILIAIAGDYTARSHVSYPNAAARQSWASSRCDFALGIMLFSCLPDSAAEFDTWCGARIVFAVMSLWTFSPLRVCSLHVGDYETTWVAS